MPFDASYTPLPAIVPTLSPQESQQRILNLRNAVQQGQITQQTLEKNALDLQAQKRALDDENKYRAIIMKRSNGSQPLDDPGPDAPAPQQAQGATAPGTGIPLHSFDAAGTVDDLRRAGLHTHADALAGTILKQQAEQATIDKDKAQAREYNENANTKKLETKNHAWFASTGYLMSVPPEKRAEVFPHVMQTLIAADVEDPKLAGMTYEQFGGDEGLTRAHAIAGTQVEKDAEEAAQREKALAPSKLKQSNADADLAQHKLDLIKNAKPEDYETLVDQIAPGAANDTLNKRTKAEARFYVGKGDIESAQKALANAGSQVGAIEKETDPRVLQSRVNQAGAIANAEIPAHVAAQVQTHQALAKLSPDAFAGIANPTNQNAAMTEADKVYKEYTDKASSTQTLLDTIAAAQKGNKAAPGVIPIEQVRSVLANGRVNTMELKGVSSNAGSLMDRIEGRLGGLKDGQPIPADLLRDTAALATITQQAARRNFDAGRDRLKMRGVDVSKLPEPNVGGGSATPGVVKWTRDANGNPVPVSQ